MFLLNSKRNNSLVLRILFTNKFTTTILLNTCLGNFFPTEPRSRLVYEQVDPRPRERRLPVEKKQKQLEPAVEQVQEESRRPRSFAFREPPQKSRRIPEAGLPERAELLSGH